MLISSSSSAVTMILLTVFIILSQSGANTALYGYLYDAVLLIIIFAWAGFTIPTTVSSMRIIKSSTFGKMDDVVKKASRYLWMMCCVAFVLIITLGAFIPSHAKQSPMLWMTFHTIYRLCEFLIGCAMLLMIGSGSPSDDSDSSMASTSGQSASHLPSHNLSTMEGRKESDWVQETGLSHVQPADDRAFRDSAGKVELPSLPAESPAETNTTEFDDQSQGDVYSLTKMIRDSFSE